MMKYHGGDWEGKKTDELELLSIEYADRFGTWPDGYEDIAINLLDYDDYIQVIQVCLKKNIEIWEYLPEEFFLDT